MEQLAEKLEIKSPAEKPDFIKDGSVQISMNARDAMVFIKVNKLPEESEKRIAVLKELKKYLMAEYGAKTIIEIPQDALEEAREAGLSGDTGKVLMIPVDVLKSNIAKKINKEEKVKQCLYQLRHGPEDHKEEIDHQQLYDFKRNNVTFVNQDKESAGIYSKIAERKKINTSGVEYFSLVDGEKNILATLMVAINAGGTLAYASDLIVAKDKRQQCIAQIIVVKVFEILQKKYPNIRNISFIAGGDGQKDAGKKLYQKLGAQPSAEIERDMKDIGISKSAQQAKPVSAVVAMFSNDLGPKFLAAAERHLEPPYYSRDPQPLRNDKPSVYSGKVPFLPPPSPVSQQNLEPAALHQIMPDKVGDPAAVSEPIQQKSAL